MLDIEFGLSYTLIFFPPNALNLYFTCSCNFPSVCFVYLSYARYNIGLDVCAGQKNEVNMNYILWIICFFFFFSNFNIHYVFNTNATRIYCNNFLVFINSYDTRLYLYILNVWLERWPKLISLYGIERWATGLKMLVLPVLPST